MVVELLLRVSEREVERMGERERMGIRGRGW